MLKVTVIPPTLNIVTFTPINTIAKRRVAGNTVDSLTTVRKLKEKSMEVYFEKKNTLTAKVP